VTTRISRSSVRCGSEIPDEWSANRKPSGFQEVVLIQKSAYGK
jgi:hypothetical protein